MDDYIHKLCIKTFAVMAKNAGFETVKEDALNTFVGVMDQFMKRFCDLLKAYTELRDPISTEPTVLDVMMVYKELEIHPQLMVQFMQELGGAVPFPHPVLAGPVRRPNDLGIPPADHPELLTRPDHIPPHMPLLNPDPPKKDPENSEEKARVEAKENDSTKQQRGRNLPSEAGPSKKRSPNWWKDVDPVSLFCPHYGHCGKGPDTGPPPTLARNLRRATPLKEVPRRRPVPLAKEEPPSPPPAPVIKQATTSSGVGGATDAEWSAALMATPVGLPLKRALEPVRSLLDELPTIESAVCGTPITAVTPSSKKAAKKRPAPSRSKSASKKRRLVSSLPKPKPIIPEGTLPAIETSTPLLKRPTAKRKSPALSPLKSASPATSALSIRKPSVSSRNESLTSSPVLRVSSRRLTLSSDISSEVFPDVPPKRSSRSPVRSSHSGSKPSQVGYAAARIKKRVFGVGASTNAEPLVEPLRLKIKDVVPEKKKTKKRGHSRKKKRPVKETLPVERVTMDTDSGEETDPMTQESAMLFEPEKKNLSVSTVSGIKMKISLKSADSVQIVKPPTPTTPPMRTTQVHTELSDFVDRSRHSTKSDSSSMSTLPMSLPNDSFLKMEPVEVSAQKLADSRDMKPPIEPGLLSTGKSATSVKPSRLILNLYGVKVSDQMITYDQNKTEDSSSMSGSPRRSSVSEDVLPKLTLLSTSQLVDLPSSEESVDMALPELAEVVRGDQVTPVSPVPLDEGDRAPPAFPVSIDEEEPEVDQVTPVFPVPQLVAVPVPVTTVSAVAKRPPPRKTPRRGKAPKKKQKIKQETLFPEEVAIPPSSKPIKKEIDFLEEVPTPSSSGTAPRSTGRAAKKQTAKKGATRATSSKKEPEKDLPGDPRLMKREDIPPGYCRYYDSTYGQVWLCPICMSEGGGLEMVGCDGCDDWYHLDCMGLKNVPEAESWFCLKCRGLPLPAKPPQIGLSVVPSTKAKSKRGKKR